MVLGWLTKERKKKEEMNNCDFHPFQVYRFKIVAIHIAITTLDFMGLYMLLYALLDASNCSPGNDITA